MCWLFARPALADADLRPRLLLYLGWSVITGPKVEVDGVSSDRPWATILPDYAARFEVPLSTALVAGVQAALNPWTTDFEDDEGVSLHYTADFSLFPKLRIAPYAGVEHTEYYIGVPFGPSLDMADNYVDAEHDATHVQVRSKDTWGYHGGLVIGSARMRPYTHWAWTAEGGILFRHAERTYAFEIDGKALREHEKVVYLPITFFVRIGGLFAFGS
jgi:hypothetical protein